MYNKSIKGDVSGNLLKFKQRELPPNWVQPKNWSLITLKEGINNSKYKRRHGWKNLRRLKRIEIAVFGKFVSLAVFQGSFFSFVKFEIMLERHICFTGRNDFEIHKYYPWNKDAESELASRDVTAPFFSELKQQRRRPLRKRHLKTYFALPQTLSRLFQLVQLVKCWQFFLELNSERLYQS